MPSLIMTDKGTSTRHKKGLDIIYLVDPSDSFALDISRVLTSRTAFSMQDSKGGNRSHGPIRGIQSGFFLRSSFFFFSTPTVYPVIPPRSPKIVSIRFVCFRGSVRIIGYMCMTESATINQTGERRCWRAFFQRRNSDIRGQFLLCTKNRIAGSLNQFRRSMNSRQTAACSQDPTSNLFFQHIFLFLGNRKKFRSLRKKSKKVWKNKSHQKALNLPGHTSTYVIDVVRFTDDVHLS